MADIELVIKIPEEKYKKISNSNPSLADDFSIYYAIKNGIPLPKGHGRILDEKEILNTEKHDGGWYDLVDLPEYIAGVSAIVEADTTESEDRCKNCEYFHNPDYTRCHECKAESEAET